MSGISEHCLFRSAHICWAQDKERSFLLKRSFGLFSRLWKYCVGHTSRYIFTSVNGDLCVSHHIPSEGSSLCRCITLGLHEEESSIRSGSNKSSLTGGMVHLRKRSTEWIYCFHLSSPFPIQTGGATSKVMGLAFIWPNNPVRNNNNNKWWVIVLSYLKIFSTKCLISGMCFCSAVPWSVLIFPFPLVRSWVSALLSCGWWYKKRHWPKDVYI